MTFLMYLFIFLIPYMQKKNLTDVTFQTFLRKHAFNSFYFRSNHDSTFDSTSIVSIHLPHNTIIAVVFLLNE